MSEFTRAEQQRRDELLEKLLKMPPHPRPKRDRSKEPTRPSAETDNDEMPEPSA